jgi:hypothetical protein
VSVSSIATSAEAASSGMAAAPIRDPGYEIAPDLCGRTASIGPEQFPQAVKRWTNNACGAPANALVPTFGSSCDLTEDDICVPNAVIVF